MADDITFSGAPDGQGDSTMSNILAGTGASSASDFQPTPTPTAQPQPQGNPPMAEILSGTGVDPNSAQPFNPISQPTQPAQPEQPAQPAAQPGKKWEAILTGALVGLAGAGGAKNFAQGMAGGAKSSLAYNQQQKENTVQQQELDMQHQRLQIDQQQSADQHATAQQQLAVSQANLAILHTQYNTMPKTVQDILDHADMQAGSVLRSEGTPVVSGPDGLSYSDAQQRVMAERNANPNSALQFVMHTRPDGRMDVFQVTDPNKTNDAPLDVTIGYNLQTGKPISKHYDAHSISIAQYHNLETNAATNLVAQQNDLTKFSKEQQIETAQAGPRAYAAASAQARVAQQMAGAPKDANGNWNPTSIPVSLVEGGMDPSQLSKRSKDYNQQLQLANQYSMEKYGKPFDIAQAQSDYKYASNVQTQNTLRMINGMTEPNGAISIAQNAAKSLPRFNVQTINKVFNSGATEFGNPAATNFHTAMLGLADEYSKVMGGGVSSDTGRQQALDILKAAYSKGQLGGAINTMFSDLGARKSALIGGNRYLMRQFGSQPQAQTSGAPQGATGKVRGSDGNWYWTDGHNNLGRAQ